MKTIQKTPERMEILKQRKRESRNDESVIFDGMMYLMIQNGYDITIKKSKKTTQTIKMYLPEKIERKGEIIDHETLIEYSREILKERGYERIEEEKIHKMTAKQYKRTKEAQMNNGIIYIYQKKNVDIEWKRKK